MYTCLCMKVDDAHPHATNVSLDSTRLDSTRLDMHPPAMGHSCTNHGQVREDTKTEVAAAAAEQFFTTRVRTAETVRCEELAHEHAHAHAHARVRMAETVRVTYDTA